MIFLLILACVLSILFILFGLRKSSPVSPVTDPLFISCSRPSERKEIGCWLFTVSLWNRDVLPLHIERMEVITPAGEHLPVLPPPQEHPRAAVFHHALQLPFALHPHASIIFIAAVAATPASPMADPGRCLLRVHAGGTLHDVPLFRMSFS